MAYEAALEALPDADSALVALGTPVAEALGRPPGELGRVTGSGQDENAKEGE